MDCVAAVGGLVHPRRSARKSPAQHSSTARQEILLEPEAGCGPVRLYGKQRPSHSLAMWEGPLHVPDEFGVVDRLPAVFKWADAVLLSTLWPVNPPAFSAEPGEILGKTAPGPEPFQSPHMPGTCEGQHPKGTGIDDMLIHERVVLQR